MKVYLFFILSIGLLTSCAPGGSSNNLKPLNLLKKGGIPITILAPDSAQIQTMDLIVQKDVSIKGDDNYYVQIFASDAASTDVLRLKNDMLSEVKAFPYFEKIIAEENDGFIFENKIDSLQSSYDFRFVKVKGNTEYRFQAGLIGTFTQAEAELMYHAVTSE